MQFPKMMLLGLLSAGISLCADVSGKWEALTETPRGEVKMTLNLEAKGDALTGTIAAGRMRESAIQDGKIAGDEISFKQVMSRGDREMTIEWKGVLKGDELELTRSLAGAPGRGGAGGQGQRPQRKEGARTGSRPNPTITAKRVP